jgi:YjjG family noncanonical pyrimidine nucleotidase
MKKNNITDIYFDLDHTLWDFEKNSALAFETILKKHRIEVDIQAFVKHYVPINMQYWELYRHDKITQYELRIGRLKDTFALVNYQTDDETILLLADEYVHYLPTFNHLFEGAIEILTYLKAKYRLHIITNGFKAIQAGKLKNTNLDAYFNTVTDSEMAGVKKPNPKIYQYALSRSNVKKENAIMIGDCIDADVNGALKFGIDAIWFNEHSKPVPEGIKQVERLLDLKLFL